MGVPARDSQPLDFGGSSGSLSPSGAPLCWAHIRQPLWGWGWEELTWDSAGEGLADTFRCRGNCPRSQGEVVYSNRDPTGEDTSVT